MKLTANDLKIILEEGEGQKIEFKESFSQSFKESFSQSFKESFSQSLVKEIVAFAKKKRKKRDRTIFFVFEI